MVVRGLSPLLQRAGPRIRGPVPIFSQSLRGYLALAPRECPKFRANENGMVPFGPRLDRPSTKILAGLRHAARTWASAQPLHPPQVVNEQEELDEL